MQKYLEATEIIDYHDEDIQVLAKALAKDTSDDTHIAKKCFEYVRDQITHSGDCKDNGITTFKASDVLKRKKGWCYGKSHLLAALLRANGIPAGFCYQRLSCSEYVPDIYCLHGLNYIYLKEFGWYKVDARGNKEGVNAAFTPPHEQLAFKLQEHEFDLNENLAEPLKVVVDTLKTYKSYDEVISHLPDIDNLNAV